MTKGREADQMAKYAEAFACSAASAPSHPGRNRLMPTPKAAAASPTTKLNSMDCRSTPRASCWRSAPRYCAT